MDSWVDAPNSNTYNIRNTGVYTLDRMTLPTLLLLLCLAVGRTAWASDIPQDEKIWGYQAMKKKESALPIVGFFALREGICREIYLQDDKVISVKEIECPRDELMKYINAKPPERRE